MVITLKKILLNIQKNTSPNSDDEEEVDDSE